MFARLLPALLATITAGRRRVGADAASRRTLALALCELRRYEEAIEALRGVIDLGSPAPEDHNDLGAAYSKRDRNAEAVACFRETIRLAPDYAGAHFNLGVALLALSDKAAALETHAVLRRLDPGLAGKLYEAIYRDRVVVSKGG